MSLVDDDLTLRGAGTAAPARDVVYVLHSATWQAARRRGLFMPEDRLVTSLLGSERVGRLLVCNHPRSWPIKALRDLTEARRAAPFPAGERARRVEPTPGEATPGEATPGEPTPGETVPAEPTLVEPTRLRRSDPTHVGAARRAAAAYDRALARAVRRHGLTDPVAIVAHPVIAGLAELAWADGVTWYATDDWANHPGYRRWWPVYRESTRGVRERGRRVVAVSSVLRDRIAPTGASAVIPNGLDPAEWNGPVTAPDWLADRPAGPLLVYAGTLDQRLDVAWVRATARAHPRATIALVGPLVDPAHLAPLRALGNVRLHGPVGRAALAGLIRSADAGLLPHRVTALTEAMSPLKVLEYLAGGLPVAATDLLPVRALGAPGVTLVPAGGDYAAGVAAALARGRTGEDERLAFVRASSWSSRHDALLDLALRA